MEENELTLPVTIGVGLSSEVQYFSCAYEKETSGKSFILNGLVEELEQFCEVVWVIT